MFYGREEELDSLMHHWHKFNPSSLITCRGRRRVGKSRLIEEFARRSRARFLRLEGIPPGKGVNNQTQLDAVADQIADYTSSPRVSLDNWLSAFALINRAIDPRVKTVLLLDEISWMGKYDATFSGYLKTAWDTLFHKNEKLIVVLCGSVSAWINDEILHSTGFVGRVSSDMVIRELPPVDCLKFWGKRAAKVSTREVLDLLSVTGGVPRYLEEIDPAVSVEENLKRMCFSPDGFLFKDFERIFTDVFGNGADEKRRLLEAMDHGPCTAAELSERLAIPRNGHLSRSLEELVLAGFVDASKDVDLKNGGRTKRIVYRIRDNYVRFFLRTIRPNAALIESGAFRFTGLDRLPGWNSILGLQFENLVVNNLRPLVEALRIGGTLVNFAEPFRHVVKGDPGKGFQIDLVIGTNRALYTVEVKRRKELGKDVEVEMDRKISCLPRRRDVSIRTVLVYDGELTAQLEADNYFDYLLPADELLLGRKSDHLPWRVTVRRSPFTGAKWNGENP